MVKRYYSYTTNNLIEPIKLTLSTGWLAAAGASQASIMSYVRRRNFLSARWPVTWMDKASVLKQQYSKKFLAYRDGCFIDSAASALKLSWSSLEGIPRILHHLIFIVCINIDKKYWPYSSHNKWIWMELGCLMSILRTQYYEEISKNTGTRFISC